MQTKSSNVYMTHPSFYPLLLYHVNRKTIPEIKTMIVDKKTSHVIRICLLFTLIALPFFVGFIFTPFLTLLNYICNKLYSLIPGPPVTLK